MTRWNLTVDEDTDRLVRTHLATCGMTKGDLSDFVDRAVKRAVFWETVDAARERNRDMDPAEIEAAMDEALEQARAARS